MPEALQPVELADALVALAQRAADANPLLPIAGGTDIWPAHVGRPVVEPLLDLSRLNSLRGIALVSHEGGSAIRIGAFTRWRDLADRTSPLLANSLFDGLVAAAREVGGEQIQNRGTLGGNICHASPAADGVPALLALDARVSLCSARGSRVLPLQHFLLGARRTALLPDELLEAFLVPVTPSSPAGSSFLKLGHRRYLVISAVMVAVTLTWDADARDGRLKGSRLNALAACRVAVGACGPVATRLASLEQTLVGMSLENLLQWSANPGVVDAAAVVSPIDDMRGSRAWRLAMVDVLVRRAVAAAVASSVSASESALASASVSAGTP